MKKHLAVSLFLLSVSLSEAQVPVSKEPRHRPVFENEKVRLLNVLLPAGDTTQYHLHSTPSLFIVLSKTITGSQLINQQPVIGTASTPGYMWFENLGAPHSKIHRVWNTDTVLFHVVDIELLSTDSGFTQKPIVGKYLRLTIDTPWVRGYKIDLKKDEQFTLKEEKRSLVLIAVKETTITLTINKTQSIKSFPEGGFLWIKPGDEINLANNQALNASFVLAEIR